MVCGCSSWMKPKKLLRVSPLEKVEWYDLHRVHNLLHHLIGGLFSKRFDEGFPGVVHATFCDEVLGLRELVELVYDSLPSLRSDLLESSHLVRNHLNLVGV